MIFLNKQFLLITTITLFGNVTLLRSADITENTSQPEQQLLEQLLASAAQHAEEAAAFADSFHGNIGALHEKAAAALSATNLLPYHKHKTNFTQEDANNLITLFEQIPPLIETITSDTLSLEKELEKLQIALENDTDEANKKELEKTIATITERLDEIKEASFNLKNLSLEHTSALETMAVEKVAPLYCQAFLGKQKGTTPPFSKNTNTVTNHLGMMLYRSPKNALTFCEAIVTINAMHSMIETITNKTNAQIENATQTEQEEKEQELQSLHAAEIETYEKELRNAQNKIIQQQKETLATGQTYASGNHTESQPEQSLEQLLASAEQHAQEAVAFAGTFHDEIGVFNRKAAAALSTENLLPYQPDGKNYTQENADSLVIFFQTELFNIRKKIENDNTSLKNLLSDLNTKLKKSTDEKEQESLEKTITLLNTTLGRVKDASSQINALPFDHIGALDTMALNTFKLYHDVYINPKKGITTAFLVNTKALKNHLAAILHTSPNNAPTLCRAIFTIESMFLMVKLLTNEPDSLTEANTEFSRIKTAHHSKRPSSAEQSFLSSIFQPKRTDTLPNTSETIEHQQQTMRIDYIFSPQKSETPLYVDTTKGDTKKVVVAAPANTTTNAAQALTGEREKQTANTVKKIKKVAFYGTLTTGALVALYARGYYTNSDSFLPGQSAFNTCFEKTISWAAQTQTTAFLQSALKRPSEKVGLPIVEKIVTKVTKPTLTAFGSLFPERWLLQ